MIANKHICIPVFSNSLLTARLGAQALLAGLALLLRLDGGLGHFFLLVTPSLRIILFDHDAVFKLLRLDLIQVLRLDDVLEAALVTIALELAQQVQLVTLELLNTLIERRDTVKHLIVLVLEFETVLLSLTQLLLKKLFLALKPHVLFLFIVKVVLDCSPGRYGPL